MVVIAQAYQGDSRRIWYDRVLVQRSYSDKYNLIACAIGHHIYESRWLRDPKYLDQIIHTWYRGNDGGPMKKMDKFSSWNADAVLARYMVDGDKDFMLDMTKDLETEYQRWERTNRLKNGLYWQGDVQDGMEESISGGRKRNMPVRRLTAICMVMQKPFR